MHRLPIRRQLYPVPQFTVHDVTSDDPQELLAFIELSVALTGFSSAELHATGQVRFYFDELGLVLGRPIRKGYLAVKPDVVALLGDLLWGPITRNVIRMWYLGEWKQLPVDWGAGRLSSEALRGFDEFGRNVDRIISPQAYTEGLVWKAVGVNPTGAKEPGFASWVESPR